METQRSTDVVPTQPQPLSTSAPPREVSRPSEMSFSLTQGTKSDQPSSENPYAETRITFTAGTAFKAGFFGAFGVLAAWVLAVSSIGVVGWLLALLFYAMFV